MELNEREVMKIRDMLGELNDISKYIVYKDKKKAKENRKELKKVINMIDNEELEDVIDELSN